MGYSPFIGALCAAVIMCGPAAWAESPPPFPEFTFKRVKPPASDAKKRITVQIQPEAIAVARPAAPDSTDASAPLPYGWFWTSVEPDADADAARLFQALNVLTTSAQVVPAPRLQTLQTTAQAYGRDLLAASIGKRVSPAFALAVIAVESAGNPAAESRAGAQGLMQLMPKTAEAYGVSDAFDPTQNITGGISVLSDLMTTYDNDPILALAAYNAGPTAVAQHGGVPPFPETRAYVPKVLAAWRVARGLCVTPPELVTDGCVFAVGARRDG